MMKRVWCLALIIIALIHLFSADSSLADQRDYVIGAEDLLEVVVYGEEDLNQRVAVSLEGSITLSLIGKVHALGLTARQLSLAISKRYARGYLVNPQVSVFVKEYKSKKVYVLGAVTKPGTYSLSREMTLLEVLSMAQGATNEAGLDVMVIRPSSGRALNGPITLADARPDEVKSIDLKSLIDGEGASNYMVRSGDTVYVTYKMDKAIYVLGQIAKPGKYSLGRRPTLIDMISKAGGVTADAGLDVVVVRPSENGRALGPVTPERARQDELIAIDLKILLDGDLRQNLLLKDKDTVFVTHRMDNKLYILGEVQKPGKYPLERGSTVIDMLSKAGGVTSQAGTELILVRPKSNRVVKGPLTPDEVSKDEITKLDLKPLFRGDLSSNLLVRNEDTIFVPHQLSKKVYVVGAVKKPGTFPLNASSRLIEIITKTEGMSNEAGDEVLIIRPAEGNRRGPLLPEQAKASEISSVDFNTIQDGDLTKNILLKDGDTIFVPAAKAFFILGEVNKPGRYILRRGMSVLQAISTAGGLTDKAAAKKTKVLRGNGEQRKEFRVDLNSLVKPQDTIIVPESFF